MQNLYNESYQKLGIANEDEIINTLITNYKLTIELIRELFKGKLLILSKNKNEDLIENNEDLIQNNEDLKIALSRKFDNSIKENLFKDRFQNKFVIINIPGEPIESI